MNTQKSNVTEKKFFQRNPIDGLYYATNENKKELISALPEKGQEIAQALGDDLQVDNDGNIVYQKEQLVGSPLIVLMEWFLDKDMAKERPLDHKLFEKLLKNSKINIPKRWTSL